jgi:DNA polymerase III subunit epsilon
VVDTLVLARRKHPGGRNTLDDLCARYHIDRSRQSALLELSCQPRSMSS